MLREAKGDPQWVSRAFVVPKQGAKLRLFFDYRHLKSSIRDVMYPPAITEDKILSEGQNVQWTNLDLEDGFHQLLPKASTKHLTGFMTPWAVVELEVLHMGLKRPLCHISVWCHGAPPKTRKLKVAHI